MRHYLAVEAGAGSGKTFALTTRYISLVLLGAKTKEIMALTFTKKAASEMKVRILETFLDLQNHLAELQSISKTLIMDKNEIISLRDKRLSEFLEEDLKISTFDSFFASILRSFALECGLRPDFCIDDDIISLEQDEFIKQICSSQLLVDELSRYMSEFNISENAFFKFLNFFESNALNISDLNYSKPDASSVFIAANNLKNYLIKTEAKDSAIKLLINNDIDSLANKSFLERASLQGHKFFNKVYSAELDGLFNILKKELKTYYNAREKYDIGILMKYYKLYEKSKKIVNKRENSLSFADISLNTHALLNKNADDIWPMLYFRLDARINHLLIDEFQDTNLLQYEIIRPLIEEIVSGVGQGGIKTLFYVGDTKQSIYRFRGGIKELFEKVIKDFTQIERESLQQNFRSKRAIIDFANTVFKDKFYAYTEQICADVGDEVGFVKVVSADDVKEKIVDEVLSLRENGANIDNIAVLCWKNSDVAELSEMFENHKIKTNANGSLLLVQNHFAKALIEYLKFCLSGEKFYEENVFALISQKPNKVELDLTKTVSETLYFLAKKLELDFRDEDILKIIEESQSFDNVVDFALKIDSLKTPSSRQSGVGLTIMTVHKSKGLQFEHVIVGDILSTPRSGKALFFIDKNGNLHQNKIERKSFDENYKESLENEIKRDFEEEINKLYVAFTRAKSSLIVVKKNQFDENGENELVNGKNPTYFSPYKSNKKEICYLDLKECEIGKIHADMKSNVLEKKANKGKIALVDILPQNISSAKTKLDSNLSAIYFGIALHYLLEINCNFLEISESAKNSLINKFQNILDKKAIDEIILRVTSLYKSSEFLKLINNKKVFKEQSYVYENTQKRIDLMLFDQNEIYIIDYKSSRKGEAEYLKQISIYKNAISALYPKFKVKAILIYLSKDIPEFLEV